MNGELVTGSEGSISVKVDDRYMLCTPEGISFCDLQPSQVELVDMSVPPYQLRDGEGRQSSCIELFIAD
jgi:ribulose-5-phosphate 4-epimerase/fuculose-1-phosphate aldolase